MSVRLYVKLPKAEIEKEGLEKMFSEFESSFSTKLIKERKKKECRGFGFITVSDDQAADDFISKYNQQPLIYNGETYKDEDGSDFVLVIEKALPRKNKKEDEETVTTSGEQEGTADDKPQAKGKKSRKSNKTKSPKAQPSVAKAVEPDPRWAGQLSQLKEMFAAQTAK